jgi:hypothetical protein
MIVKKYLLPFAWMLMVGMLIVSCDHNNDLAPDPTDGENQSEIAVIEREAGITLFKKDLTLTDEAGRNKVVLRVAHKDEQILKSYLEVVSFAISPVFKKNVSRISAGPTGNVIENTDHKATTNLDGIITEFISKSLEPSVAGFSLRVKFKDNPMNGRSSAYGGFPNETTVTSDTWPELCKVEVFGRSIAYKFHGKTKWYSGWSSRTFCLDADPYICNSDWTQSAISTATINVDGPWKVRATIGYDANFQGDWAITFINLD